MSTTNSADKNPDLSKERGGFCCQIHGDDLQEFFKPFAAFVDEMKLQITQDGFKGRVVDPANVAMVDKSLSNQGLFEHYSSTGGTLGINLNKMTSIIGMAKKSDLIELELDQETRKLEIYFDGLSYTLALIDPNSIRQEPDIPDLDLPGRIVVDAEHLIRGIKASRMVSDHILLGIKPGENGSPIVYAVGEGDTDDAELELTENDYIEADPVEETHESLYSIDYLEDVVKAIPKNARLTLDLGSDYPLMIHYNQKDEKGVAEGPTTHMIAPRISSD